MGNKILLIDDDQAVHACVRACVASDGLELFGELNGTSGILAAKSLQPDIILLDDAMPGLDGFETCELLTVQSETSHIPILFLSDSNTPADRVKGFNHGATDFIAKPFFPDELRARISVALRYKALLEMESRRALRDGLTGLWNRAFLDDRLAVESASALRHGRPLACIMLDLDHFKAINDTFGHSAGDEVIRTVGGLLVDRCRIEDIVCRYGGEEFAVLCPATTAEAATILAERLRLAVSQLSFRGALSALKVTASIGVADGATGISLLRFADQALYDAKRQGRNQVCTQTPTRPPSVAA